MRLNIRSRGRESPLRQSGEQIFGFNCPSPPPSFLPCMVWRGTRSNTWEPAAKWLQLWLANLDRHFRGPLHLGHLQRVDADSNTPKTFSRLESFSNLIREPETLAIPFLTSRSRRERFSDRAGQAGNANMLPNSVSPQSLPRACPEPAQLQSLISVHGFTEAPVLPTPTSGCVLWRAPFPLLAGTRSTQSAVGPPKFPPTPQHDIGTRS